MDEDQVAKRLNLHTWDRSTNSLSQLALSERENQLLTGVTKRGVMVTYSARLGKCARSSTFLLVMMISRGCLPMRSLWLTSPHRVFVLPFERRGLVRHKSLDL